MKIAITGANGQLGRELARLFGADGAPLDRAALDITDRTAVLRMVRELRPQSVINCAAFTQVDLAEQQADACTAANATAVRYLAEACESAGCSMVQISTDYVFGADLSRNTPYRETDPTGPQSVYARTKLCGEEHARECTRHFIVRTCGLYGGGVGTKNFVNTMLRLGQQKGRVRVVDDQHYTPSFVRDVAKAVAFLVTTTDYGLYHVVNHGATTWCTFAREIFRLAAIPAEVEPITSEEFGAAAERPGYSVLDTAKFDSLGGPPLPSWQTALADYLASLPGN